MSVETIASPAAWRSRIVGSGDVAPDQLMANPRNFRIHPKHQQDALRGSLTTLGWIEQVLVNRQTNFVIDGHARVALAIRHDQPTVPVSYVDLSPEEEAQALVSLDPIAAMAGTDAALLGDVLAELETDNAEVQAFLDGLAAEHEISDLPAFDAAAHWGGMPEYEHNDLQPVKQIMVSFASVDAVEEFSRLIGQPVAMTTRSVWFPAAPIERYMDKAYVDVGAGDAA